VRKFQQSPYGQEHSDTFPVLVDKYIGKFAIEKDLVTALTKRLQHCCECATQSIREGEVGHDLYPRFFEFEYILDLGKNSHGIYSETDVSNTFLLNGYVSQALAARREHRTTQGIKKFKKINRGK
jgi:hypothetical protein